MAAADVHTLKALYADSVCLFAKSWERRQGKGKCLNLIKIDFLRLSCPLILSSTHSQASDRTIASFNSSIAEKAFSELAPGVKQQPERYPQFEP